MYEVQAGIEPPSSSSEVLDCKYALSCKFYMVLPSNPELFMVDKTLYHLSCISNSLLGFLFGWLVVDVVIETEPYPVAQAGLELTV